MDKIDNVDRLVSLLRNISSENRYCASNTAGRPTKRARTASYSDSIAFPVRPDAAAISITHHSVAFPPKWSVLSATKVRHHVGPYLDLQLECAPNDATGHFLCIAPRNANRRNCCENFNVKLEMSRRDASSAKLRGALAAARMEVDGQPGSVWARVDVHWAEQGTSIDGICFEFNIKLNEGARTTEGKKSNQRLLAFDAVFAAWAPELALTDRPHMSLDPQDFYTAACVPDKQKVDAEVCSMRVPGLASSLFPFQKRAVQWLLRREKVEYVGGRDGSEPTVRAMMTTQSPGPPISFVERMDTSEAPYFLSPLFGYGTRDLSRFEAMQDIDGGVLADEMGLGKTLEMISLILLHRCARVERPVMDPYFDRTLRATAATLLVAPTALLDQWHDELNRHAPGLRVLSYAGIRSAMKKLKKDTVQGVVQELGSSDVVITSYEVLRRELHLALDTPERTFRRERRYERTKSALVQLYWWRVCIDEAQMVEKWTTNAAVVARMIPRRNAWAITGTPIKDSVKKDLLGLLIFLRAEPYLSEPAIWSRLTGFDRASFQKLVNLISMRHSKALVRNEISLPPQKRYVISMPFTAVEEQHYQSLFRELARTCGLDERGNPVHNDWDLGSPRVQEAMRLALDRLRQTALHPEVGAHKRRGRRACPMRTIVEVLQAMLWESDRELRTEQRALLLTRLGVGEILADMKRMDDALGIWKEVLGRSAVIVDNCCLALEAEMREAEKTATRDKRLMQDGRQGDEDDVASKRVAEARNRLRMALEVKHKAAFFLGNYYFSIRSDKQAVAAGSTRLDELEEKETEMYALAKTIRKQILHETNTRATSLMDTLAGAASKQNFAEMPAWQRLEMMGIESRRIVGALADMSALLDEQANLVDDWRERVIQLLLKPLVDEDDIEMTGEEYDESTQHQDEVLAHIQVLRAAIASRQTALTGQKNGLVEHEFNVNARMADAGRGACPELFKELVKAHADLGQPHLKRHSLPDSSSSPREQEHDPEPSQQPSDGSTTKTKSTRGKERHDGLKGLSYQNNKSLCSIRGLISEMRLLSVDLRHDVSSGKTRGAAELTILEEQIKLAQAQLKEQTKVASALQKEVDELFTNTLNARIDYYKQLQHISDMVAPFQRDLDAETLAMEREKERILQDKVTALEAKHRYLVHLQDAESSAEANQCVICQSSFSMGVLTVCGHTFCKDCLTTWIHSHHSCPVCKRSLYRSGLHDITLQPKELKIHSDPHCDAGRATETMHGPASRFSPNNNVVIYREFNPDDLASIKNIHLDGPNYTTKVDTLIRHLFWLRESDPGAKSIVFSQYKDFLKVVAGAFQRYRIGFTSFDRANGVSNFKGDASAEVFLLHARAHSSGLNLVSANHVFLCEPLLNTALELQAIARVDRIGQHHETTVWLYVVEGTVEQSIYNLSVERRMKHLGQVARTAAASEGLAEGTLDAANAFEMQQAQLSKLFGKDGVSGEAVDKQDLWSCLFGHVQQGAIVGRANGHSETGFSKGSARSGP